MRSDRWRGIVSFAASWTARPARRDGPDARRAVPGRLGVFARRWLVAAVWLVVLTAAGARLKIGGGRHHIGKDSGNAVSASGKLLRQRGAPRRTRRRGAGEHGKGGSMYYSKGNYEAFARPRKPAGVDEKSAYFVGGGLASLAGAAFLIRDGQMPGDRITVLEASRIGGGPSTERVTPRPAG